MMFINEDCLQFSFVRSGGPGGQNVNKVNTCAQLRIKLGDGDGLSAAVRQRLLLAGRRWCCGDNELLIESKQHRSQLQNRQECLLRLQAMLEQAMIVPKKRKATRKPRAAIERRLDNKKKRADIKKQRSEKFE